MDQSVIAPSAEPAEQVVVPPVVRRRGRPRDPQADVRILEAAAELILARGFDSMTVDEVAAKARVGKATVYRRWARKEDLAVAAMERLYVSEMPLPDTGTIEGDLTVTYSNVLAFANSEAGGAYLRTTIVESVRDDRIAALYRSASERAEAQAEVMFERAIERGELRPEIDLRWAVQWLTGLLAVCVITGRAMPAAAEASALVRMTLDGLRA
ncbi:MAG: TetR/AcrR family transcriptional regulator [Marmoricola sp.]